MQRHKKSFEQYRTVGLYSMFRCNAQVYDCLPATHIDLELLCIPSWLKQGKPLPFAHTRFMTSSRKKLFGDARMYHVPVRGEACWGGVGSESIQCTGGTKTREWFLGAGKTLPTRWWVCLIALAVPELAGRKGKLEKWREKTAGRLTRDFLSAQFPLSVRSTEFLDKLYVQTVCGVPVYKLVPHVKLVDIFLR